MGRKQREGRSPEEKWQIVQEGIKSGNISESCQQYGIAQTLYYRLKDEAEQKAKAKLGARCAAVAEIEKGHGIRQLEGTLGEVSGGRNSKNRRGGERAVVQLTPRRE